ncbi:MAG: GldG family protein [Sedimenticola sp.]
MKRRLESILFHLLLLLAVAMLGWLSQRHLLVADWTETGGNSLHPVSQQLLTRLDAPLEITSFAPENPALREPIAEIVERYRRFRPDIRFRFVNPALQPKLTRELGIQVSGELLLEYKGRRENLRNLDEESISNAIQRLVQQGERWLVFITGHGERRPDSRANYDLGIFGDELGRKGYQLQTLELAEQLQIPNNTGLLVIAGPQREYLPGESALITDYLARGGNLLWLTDPGSDSGLDTLAETLGIKRLPGTIVDPNARDLGLDNPAIALATRYPMHPAVANFKAITVYPYATALEAGAPDDWKKVPLLSTLERTWNETSPMQGEVSRNPEQGEQAGPLAIGYALSRPRQGGEQRVVVVGDGDFLSNSYLANAGNQDLGLNLVRWLAGDDQLLDIPARTGSDLDITLSPTAGAVIGLGFLLVVPLALFATGMLIWWRRRHGD